MTSLFDTPAGQGSSFPLSPQRRVLADYPSAEYLPAGAPLLQSAPSLQAACAVTRLTEFTVHTAVLAKTRAGRIVGTQALIVLGPLQSASEVRAAHRQAFVDMLALANQGVLPYPPQFGEMCSGDASSAPAVAADLLGRLGFNPTTTERAFSMLGQRSLRVEKSFEYAAALALASNPQSPRTIPSTIAACLTDLFKQLEGGRCLFPPDKPGVITLTLGAPDAGEQAQQQSWLTGLEDSSARTPLLSVLAGAASPYCRKGLQIELRVPGCRPAAAVISVDPSQAHGHYDRLECAAAEPAPAAPPASPRGRGRAQP